MPTRLTLSRLILAPLLLPVLFVYLLPYNIALINFLLAFLFLLFSATDFFDGYLARKYHQETDFGKLLDPIADKFLVYSTLVALLAAHKIYFFWVVLFIGREFFVMGLRQIALEHQFSISVSWGGKFKTAFQMLLLTVLIANPYQKSGWLNPWNIVELKLLVLSLLLSLVSAYFYYKACSSKLALTDAFELEAKEH